METEADNAAKRHFSRLLAYPLALIGAFAAIMFGIALSSNEWLTAVAIYSHNGTPAENWVMFLLALWISAFLYLVHAYEHRTLVVERSHVIAVVVAALLVLLFGMYGLTAMVPLVVIATVISIVVQRRRLARLMSLMDEATEGAVENKKASGEARGRAAQAGE